MPADNDCCRVTLAFGSPRAAFATFEPSRNCFKPAAVIRLNSASEWAGLPAHTMSVLGGKCPFA
jgi:hypothetical protein